ncbi:hypothetical protein HDU91_003526 [Kappamyces sp. JEL0680]|nr:hypothetical protein HDU91_003526 [Kappamyces sp. JEL0680]
MPLAPVYEQAMCFSSCLYSLHPVLLCIGLNLRIQIAKSLFPVDFEAAMAQLDWGSPRDILDTCRAFITHGRSLFFVGELDHGVRFLQQAIDLLRRARLIKYNGIAPLFDETDLHLSVWELADARHVLVEAAFLDFFMSLLSGNLWSLSLDDFPLFDGTIRPALDDSLLSTLMVYSDTDLFNNTVWSSSAHLPMFKAMRKTAYTQPKVDSFSYTRMQLQQLTLYRTIVEHYQTSCDNVQQQQVLHTSLLGCMERFGPSTLGRLDVCMTMDLDNAASLPLDFLTAAGLEALMMMSLVHVKSAATIPLFPSSLHSGKLYTSRQILVAMVRAVCSGMSSVSRQRDKNQIAPPSFVTGDFVICLYVFSRLLSSSPVLLQDLDARVETLTLISRHILPSLHLLGSIIPIALLLAKRLEQNIYA